MNLYSFRTSPHSYSRVLMRIPVSTLHMSVLIHTGFTWKMRNGISHSDADNESNSRSLSWSSTPLQCLSGNAATYLADDCQLISDVSTRRLRSTDTAMCVVRCSHNIFGDRCFATAEPRLGTRCPLNYDSVTLSGSSNSCCVAIQTTELCDICEQRRLETILLTYF